MKDDIIFTQFAIYQSQSFKITQYIQFSDMYQQRCRVKRVWGNFGAEKSVLEVKVKSLSGLYEIRQPYGRAGKVGDKNWTLKGYKNENEAVWVTETNGNRLVMFVCLVGIRWLNT
eukprot:sb/3476742/